MGRGRPFPRAHGGPRRDGQSSGRAAPGHRAGLLRRLHARRDRGHDEGAARNSERPDAPRAREDGGLPARPRPKAPRPTSLVGVGRRMPAYAAAAVALIALLTGIVIGDVAFHAPQSSPASQVARFTLAGHEEMAGAQATVIDLKRDGLVLVDFRGLPPPGSGRVYEVWLIPAKGNPVPAAVFVPDSNGAKVVLVNQSLDGYTVMAVTNEAGPDGSQAPTQQPQLYGNLT